MIRRQRNSIRSIIIPLREKVKQDVLDSRDYTCHIGDMGPMYGYRIYRLDIIGAQQVMTDHSFASWRWIIEMDHGDTTFTINFSLKQYLSSAWKSSFDSFLFLFLAHNLFVVVNT